MGTMWDMTPGLHWWEFVLRGSLMYTFVLVLIRISGKRQIGQLAPFDLVLLLILSNAVQNAMNAGDNSVQGGMISACTLVALNYFVGWLTFKSKFLEGIIEGHPVVLIHNGHINHKSMNSVRMTIHELNSALRAAGCAGPHDVQTAILENGGNITVIPHEHISGQNRPPAASPPLPPAPH